MSDDDLALLRETVRAAFDDLSPMPEVRRLMDTGSGWDRAVWTRLCREIGIAGLAVPESYGGTGGSAVELGIVFEEAGRSLLAAPLFATVGLAVPLLLALDDADALGYLPEICAGSVVATVATGDVAVSGDRLTGEAGYVIDGASADLVLVAANGHAVFAVDGAAPGLRRTPLVTLDPTRKQARLTFEDVPAQRIGAANAEPAIRHALDVARALLANEQAGGAARCLAATVDYAKSRVQFGRPIGSFQAVKQHAADLLIQVESARSAAITAAQAVAGWADAPDLPVAAAVAQAYCSEAFVRVAADMIQLHGGIGFTWEHDAHLYFKRAWTSRELLGRPEDHLEALAVLATEGSL
ncbi:MAG TPA: acyl-CoA dehydrogenase family protein [Pseudonocardiaceae bacterium]|jgi:acyl-CoA dehydrogenase|nr:acyl-CoA dehydrogenase family protein [Pseudonocardiaceae bacterium]